MFISPLSLLISSLLTFSPVAITVTMIANIFTIALLATGALAHGDHGHDQIPMQLFPQKALWYNTLPGDGGTQVRL